MIGKRHYYGATRTAVKIDSRRLIGRDSLSTRHIRKLDYLPSSEPPIMIAQKYRYKVENFKGCNGLIICELSSTAQTGKNISSFLFSLCFEKRSMGIWKLRFSMLGTLAFIIAASSLFFTVILSLMGTLTIVSLAFFVVVFNLIQWLVAPYLIDWVYRAKAISRTDNPKLYGTVENLSNRIRMKMPRVMIAQIPIPNAFAYGSPIAGSRIAVTTGLLKTLEHEEVEAVLGHELGHLKHKDVQIMMFASVLPAIFYFIGYSMMLSAWFGGGREREGDGGAAILIGMIAMIMHWILTLFVLSLSRTREYYADRRSAMIVEDGSRKLSEALAKIAASTSRNKRYYKKMSGLNSFKTLFIHDPDRAEKDEVEIARAGMFTTDQQLIQEILSRKITTLDKMLELFSTHPNLIKRLDALRNMQ